MLTGLDILLSRMKTNPEEFLYGGAVPIEGEVFGGNWADLISYAWRVANEEERQALDEARKEFYRDDFSERVMKRLAGEEQEQRPETYTYKPYATGWSDPRAQLQNAALQGSQYDPNTHGVLTTIDTSNFQAAEIRQEGMRVSAGGTRYSGMGDGFWSGITKSLGGR